MTQMESLLRAATRETAAEVTRESIPPLDLDTLPVPRRSLVRAGGALSPLLAAAAVVLVVALAVTLGTVLPSHRPPAGSGGAGAAGVPPYYAALTATGTPAAGHPVTLTVRSTFTGRVLTTVTAPRPYGTFNLVEGTADDRTFLVGAQVWHPREIPPGNVNGLNNIPEPVRLYLLHFDPSTGRTSLTALPIPQLNGQYLQEASISPDGTRVAVGYDAPQAGHPGVYETSVLIYALPAGAEHTLSLTPAQVKTSGGLALDRDNPATIAWAADNRTISFTWGGGDATTNGVHVLDTDVTGPGTLLSRSRLVLPLTGTGYGSSDFMCSSDPFLSANGAYVLCGGYTIPKGSVTRGASYPAGPVTQGFGEFSATTGKLITILAPRFGPLPVVRVKSLVSGLPSRTTADLAMLPYLLWASPDARILIGTVRGHGVVIRDGREQAIGWSSSITGTEGSQIPAIASW
jgi:hypothetical protein